MENTVTITHSLLGTSHFDQATVVVEVTTLVENRPSLQSGIAWLPYSGSQGLPAAPPLSVTTPVGANTSAGMF